MIATQSIDSCESTAKKLTRKRQPISSNNGAFISQDQMLEILGFTYGFWYKNVRNDPSFPKPSKFGKAIYLRTQIEDWLYAQTSQSQ